MATTEPDPPHHPTVPAPLEHMPVIDTETSIDLHTVGMMNKDVCGGVEVGEVGDVEEEGEAEVGNQGMDADVNEEEEEIDQLEEQEEEIVENVDEPELVEELIEADLNDKDKDDVVQVDATHITQSDTFDAVVLEDDEERNVDTASAQKPVETVEKDVEPATFVVDPEPTHDVDESNMIPLEPFPKDTYEPTTQDVHEEEYMENLDDDDMDIYEPLPCVLLEYRNGFFPMFAPYTPSPAVAAAAMTEARSRGTLVPPIVPAHDQRVLFGSDDYIPVSTPLKQNITDTDMVNNVLYESPMYYLIRELKSVFGIPDTNDVSMEFPDLDIRVHQDMGCIVNRVSVKQMTEFHRLVYEKRCNDDEVVGVGVEAMGPLRIVMIRHSWSVMKRIAWLEELAKEGGMNTNPIVLDSEGDDEDELRGKRVDGAGKSGDESGRLRDEIDDMIHDEEEEEEDYDMEEIQADVEETVEVAAEEAAEEAVELTEDAEEVAKSAQEATVEIAEAEASTELTKTTKEIEEVVETTAEEVVVETIETVKEIVQDLTEKHINDLVTVVDSTVDDDVVNPVVQNDVVEHGVEIGDMTGDGEMVIENGVLEDWHDDDDDDNVESNEVYDDDQPIDEQHDDVQPNGDDEQHDEVIIKNTTETIDNDTSDMIGGEKRDRDDTVYDNDSVAKRVRI